MRHLSLSLPSKSHCQWESEGRLGRRDKIMEIKVFGRKYRYALLVSGSHLAWWHMCFQSGRSLWASGRGLSSAAHIHSLPARQQWGVLVPRAWKNRPQLAWALFVWHTCAYEHMCTVWGFILIETSLFGHLDCKVSGGLWMHIRAFWVARRRLQRFSFFPTSPSIRMHCYRLKCFGTRPGNRGRGPLHRFLMVCGRLWLEEGLQSSGQNAKGCAESVFVPLQPVSTLVFDSGPLSLTKPPLSVPGGSCTTPAAEATFLSGKSYYVA